MARSNRAHHKERFQPWLIKQLDSKSHGLGWLDDARTQFSIPWKSVKQKDTTDKDFAIFKAWAEESGKYSKYVEDRTRWKTNFRAAMNSIKVNGQSVFLQVDQASIHRNPADPHKVFQICHAGDRQVAEDQLIAHATERGYLDNTPGSMLIGFLQEVSLVDHAPYNTVNRPEENSFYAMGGTLGNLAASEHEPVQRDFNYPLPELLMQSPPAPLAVTNQPQHPVRYPDNNAFYGLFMREAALGTGEACGAGNTPEEISFYSLREQWNNLGAPGACPILNDLSDPVTGLRQKPPQQNPLQHAAVPTQPHNPAATEAPCRKRPRSDYCPSAYEEPQQQDPVADRVLYDARVTPGVQGPESAMMAQGCPQHGQTPPAAGELQSAGDLVSCLELTIYYRGKHVLQKEVNHSRQLLHYNWEGPSLGPLTAVRFPSPDDLPDQKQVKLTKKVLEEIKRGLLLEVKRNEKKIYATWLGRSCYKVFYARSGQLSRLTSSPEPEFLKKKVETEIFNFKTFLTELEEYRNGRRKSPDFTIYLCFGQQFRVEKPKEEKLVLVKIVPRYCVYWYEFEQRRGASSLNSQLASLHISSGGTSVIEAPTFKDLLQAFEDSWT